MSGMKDNICPRGGNGRRVRLKPVILQVRILPRVQNIHKYNMEYDTIKLIDIVKGTADLSCVRAGGIAVYDLRDVNGNLYQIEIDLSNKDDVGNTCTFLLHYDKPIYLMRWIRRAIDKKTIIKLN